MGKKKLWSAVSAMKLSEAILSNYSGRIGGIMGLDRDIQLRLLSMAEEKANYWRTKQGPYHVLRTQVRAILNKYGIPYYESAPYYAFAEKVMKAYAMYPEDVAYQYERVIEYQFATLDPNVLAEIADVASELGKSISGLYHLAPISE
jgi:hypothetical protein